MVTFITVGSALFCFIRCVWSFFFLWMVLGESDTSGVTETQSVQQVQGTLKKVTPTHEVVLSDRVMSSFGAAGDATYTTFG